MNNQIVTVNLTPGGSAPAVVRVSQGDVGRPILFKVLDGTAQAAFASGTVAKIEGTKPSGLGFSETGTISGNTVTLNTTLAMTQEAGSIWSEIRFRITNGPDIGTANFILYVEPETHNSSTTDGTYETMDALEARVAALEAEMSGGTGITDEEKALILDLFAKAAYADDDAALSYEELSALWTIITRSVSYSLTHVTSSNTSASVQSGSSYTTTLTADTNYTLNTVSVTMGGVDITSTAYSSGTVSIASVTGNIVITATAVAQQDTYVQDGLVMWLDGEYNSTNGAHATSLATWVDQTGNGWDWTNRGGATVSTKSVVFGGSDTANFTATSVPTNIVMMEIVYKVSNNGGGVILAGFGRNYIGNISIASSTGKLSFHTSTGSAESSNTAFEIGYDSTIHSVNSAGYVDGEAYTTTTSAADWQYTYPSLGYYRGTNGSQVQYKFTGEIYCIRLYSRALTADEIAHNYAIDAERFEIGA